MTASSARSLSPHDVRPFLSLLHDTGGVFEIRVPKYGKYKSTASGYFNDIDAAAQAVVRWDGKANIYVTLNSADPALLARAANRIVERAESTTADADVVRRRRLVIDIDPARASGISSTGDELLAATGMADAVAAFLRNAGWPDPVMAMSGNGAYLVYRIDLANDAESTDLIRRVLEALAARFDTAGAHIDRTVFNASRIIGLIGTLKVKGDPMPDRPHRRSSLLSVPGVLGCVTPEQLKALAAPPTPKTSVTAAGGSTERLTDILRRHNIEFQEQPPDANGMTWYHVRQCPFHEDGRPFECGVGQMLPDGPYAGKCFHPQGDGKGWQGWKIALALDVGRRARDPAIVSSHDEPLTDAGNGEYFARMYGDRVRYDHRRRRWLMWDRHRWSDDADGEIRRLAKLAVRHRLLSTTKIEDLTRRGQAAKFAIQSEHRQRLDALLAQAQTEPPITDAGKHWDRDPLLFGAQNGILDLRTGRLRDGRPEDRITLHTAIGFDAKAACPRWLRFLDEVFGADVELIDFIQRAVGYSLTGLTTEQCLFLCYGTGANGKSVFLRVLRMLAGLHAFNAPFSLFEMHSRSAIPNDLAALVNRRLVTSSETNEGTRLNEARVKALTGCDPITARFMRAEFFTFEPVAKYWLAVNHKPSVADDSHGFWRRVRLIPFTRRFSGPAADQSLTDTLQTELPGILAWAVRGALAWQERGLPAPAAVHAATETYRLESDPLAAFIDGRCVVAEGVSVASSQAFKAYLAWGGEQGMRERELLTSTLFGKRMSERFEKKHASSGNRYLGVGLLSDHDDPQQGDVVKGLELPTDVSDAGCEPEVKGSVTGLESDDRESEVNALEISLTRSNPEKPFTTLHPVTERRSGSTSRPVCKRCGHELNLVATSNLCEGCKSDAVRGMEASR